MLAVRAKLVLDSVEDVENSPGTKLLKFSARLDERIPEDHRFAKATPSATLEMQVNTPNALATFIQGKTYYCDFNPADEPPVKGVVMQPVVPATQAQHTPPKITPSISSNRK